jgi:HSP20 family protein
MFLQLHKTMLDDLFDLQERIVRTESKSAMKIEDDTLIMNFDVPGFSKKDFKITVEDTTLVIDGTTETRKFFKSYKLQKDWDTAKIEAKVKDGILTIDIPKREEKKAKLITVDVK